VGMVQEKLDAVQHDTEPRAMTAFNYCTQVVKQRFNFAPMDVGADRVGKYGV